MTISEYKGKIQEYENEIQKLERQKIEYLEVDKKPPKRIEKRMFECECIVGFFKYKIDTIKELEFKLEQSKREFVLHGGVII